MLHRTRCSSKEATGPPASAAGEDSTRPKWPCSLHPPSGKIRRTLDKNKNRKRRKKKGVTKTQVRLLLGKNRPTLDKNKKPGKMSRQDRENGKTRKLGKEKTREHVGRHRHVSLAKNLSSGALFGGDCRFRHNFPYSTTGIYSPEKLYCTKLELKRPPNT